jgi:hypothetical protein
VTAEREPFVVAGTSSLKSRPARHLNSLTVHPAILVREKRSDHRSNVIRYSRTTQCGHFGNLSVDLGIVPHHATAKIGLNRARRDQICGDRTRSEFLGQVAGQNRRLLLRLRMQNSREKRSVSGPMKYSRCVRRRSSRAAISGKEVDAFEMDVDHLIELGLRHLLKADVQGIACIVHKVVKVLPSPGPQHLAHICYEPVE